MWNKFCFRLALLLALSGCCMSITVIRDESGDRIVGGTHCESGETLFQGGCIKDPSETDCRLQINGKTENLIPLLTKETFNQTMEMKINCHSSSSIDPLLSLEDGADSYKWKKDARVNDIAIFETIDSQILKIRFKKYFPGILLRIQLICRNPLPSFTDKNGCVIVRFNGTVEYPLPNVFPPLPTSKPTTPSSTTPVSTTTFSTTPVSTASTTDVIKPENDEVDGNLPMFIGVGIGAVVLVVVLIVLVILVRRRRKSAIEKGHKYTSNDDRPYEDIDTVNSQYNKGKTGEHANEPNIYQYASTNEAIRPVYQNQNGFKGKEFLQNNQADYAQVSKSNENYEMVPQYSDPKVENKPSRPNFPPNIDYSSEYDIPIQEEEKEIPEYAAVQKKVKK